jgi:hypothetical protein
MRPAVSSSVYIASQPAPIDIHRRPGNDGGGLIIRGLIVAPLLTVLGHQVDERSPLPDAPEHPVPPPAGQQQLPPELPWRLLVPAVDASAGVTDEAVPWAVAQAMPTVPNFGHAPLRLGFCTSPYTPLEPIPTPLLPTLSPASSAGTCARANADVLTRMQQASLVAQPTGCSSCCSSHASSGVH